MNGHLTSKAPIFDFKEVSGTPHHGVYVPSRVRGFAYAHRLPTYSDVGDRLLDLGLRRLLPVS